MEKLWLEADAARVRHHSQHPRRWVSQCHILWPLQGALLANSFMFGFLERKVAFLVCSESSAARRQTDSLADHGHGCESQHRIHGGPAADEIMKFGIKTDVISRSGTALRSGFGSRCLVWCSPHISCASGLRTMSCGTFLKRIETNYPMYHNVSMHET